ncbi:MAG: methylated-DNA--[protein]-cysteine S-methyltransferase [Negativicutes bacterium]|nr:methylated-DNA--[protein]-cysteine S-methyltransferase [Negativicutes bacterium]
MVNKSFGKTCIGLISIEDNGYALPKISFEDISAEDSVYKSYLAEMAIKQLNEYFSGIRFDFSLPLAPAGTPFMLEVWKALAAIPYGEVRAYGDIAELIGRPKAARAVGMANNRNPLPIIVPCHRVIGANGKLVGYAGGLEKKGILLALENENKKYFVAKMNKKQ